LAKALRSALGKAFSGTRESVLGKAFLGKRCWGSAVEKSAWEPLEIAA
jgi:hypothetical protein